MHPQVSASTEEQSASVEEMSAGAQELSALATGLQDLVARFTLTAAVATVQTLPTRRASRAERVA